MSELFLIRHGQASFGAANYDCLSETGHQQARYLGRYLRQRGVSFDLAFCGAMQRHRQTLESIYQGLERPLPEIREHPGLNEYDFAELIRLYREQAPEDPEVLALNKNRGNKPLFYRLLRRILSLWSANQLQGVSETWDQFVDRVDAARDLMRESAEPGNRVLAVSSGGAISQYVGGVLDLTPERVFDLNLQTRNAGLTHFYFNREKFHLSQFNAVPHLNIPGEEQLMTYG